MISRPRSFYMGEGAGESLSELLGIETESDLVVVPLDYWNEPLGWRVVRVGGHFEAVRMRYAGD